MDWQHHNKLVQLRGAMLPFFCCCRKPLKKKEGNETVTNCNRLKLRAIDGKMRMIDVADSERLGRSVITRQNASDYILPNEEDTPLLE